jgi:glc operon protein GlcG
MVPTVPGQIATVLVALALIDGRPSQINVGNVSSVPPAATEFMEPATKAELNATNACQELTLGNTIRKNMRQKFSLTSAEAHAVVTAAKLEAVKNNWKVSIAVVDESGYLLHLDRMDGATLPSPEIATMKARTAALSRVPTKFLEDVTKERAATLMFPGRLPVQGGLPILYEGECVGAVGVSGVKSPEDEQIASAGLAVLTWK